MFFSDLDATTTPSPPPDPEEPLEYMEDILSGPSEESLKRRRTALVPSKKTDEELRYVASKTAALTALAAVKLKKMHPTR